MRFMAVSVDNENHLARKTNFMRHPLTVSYKKKVFVMTNVLHILHRPFVEDS